MIETYIFIYRQEDFNQKDIPELIKDIWTFSDNHGKKMLRFFKIQRLGHSGIKSKMERRLRRHRDGFTLHCLYIRKTHWLKNTKISREHKKFIYSFLNN